LTIAGCLLCLAFSLLTQNCLAQTGTLLGFGNNQNGQLGDNTQINRSVPVKVMTDIKAIAAGQYFSLALDDNGQV
jgi:alpha-tubulin suppressor-like RCC1 family protein